MISFIITAIFFLFKVTIILAIGACILAVVWSILGALLGSLFEAITSSKRAMGLTLTIGIILAIHFFGLSTVIKAILLICFICCVRLIIKTRRKRRYKSWIEKVGIGKCSESPVNIKSLDYVIFIDDKHDYMISDQFYEKIRADLVSNMFVTEEYIWFRAANILPTFSIGKVPLLIHFLLKRHNLIKIEYLSGPPCYMAESLISSCKTLFESEGAATKEEFTRLCESYPLFESFDKELFEPLAKTFLDNMVIFNQIKSETLDSGLQLYISKSYSPNSKMTHVEINLDS